MHTARDVFLDAIERPASERDAFVASRCAGDDKLRGEVMLLLRAHEDASRFMKASTIAPERARESRDDRAGDVLGRYQLVKLLGEGGFGKVFLADQTEPVQRKVALKILKRGFAGAILQRFEAERQTLAMMDHPGIARVLDAGETDTGRPFFVMEYVNGEAITAFCAARGYDVRQRLMVLQDVCLAVQHAHLKGIIHRDLKPGNILVSEVDGRPLAKVIDFGIAKATDEDPAMPELTQEMQIVGTPQYMSPEQTVTGKHRAIDTRSDVYSLGTVMYELLAGAPPFDPKVLRESAMEHVLQIIRQQQPAKPSTRVTESALQRTVVSSRDLTGELDWIVMRALEKEPGRRYQTASDLAADIARFLRDEPVLAGPPGTVYRMRKFATRHRWAVTAASVGIASLIGATVVSTVMARRARQAEAQANVERDNAREQLRRATAITEFTGDLLAGVGPAKARGRDTKLLSDLLDRAVAQSNLRFKDDRALRLSVHHLIGQALYDIGDHERNVALLKSDFPSPDSIDTDESALAAIPYAKSLMDQDQDALAGTFIDRVLERGKNPVTIRKAKFARANLAVRTGDYDIAKKLAGEVIADCAAAGLADTRESLLARNMLAMATYGSEDLPAAATLWAEIAPDMERVLGNDDPSVVNVRGNLASVLMDLDRMDEADAQYKLLIATASRVFEPHQPLRIAHVINYTEFLMSRNRAAEAEPLLEEAVKHQARLQQDAPYIAWSLDVQRQKCFERLGKWDAMLEISMKMWRNNETRFGHPDKRTFGSYAAVIRAYTGAGRYAEADQFIADIGPRVVPDDADPASVQAYHIAVGHLCLKQNKLDEARQHCNTALATIVPGPDGKPRKLSGLVELEAALK
jgi:eukaryotic-like serine/threonine-protein kinase